MRFRVMFRSFFIVLVLFGACITSSLAGDTSVIIAFGDSITTGAWENDIRSGDGSRTGGYEPDIELLTDLQNNHHDVLNYGLAGEKTVEQEDEKGGYRRLVEDVLPKHPDAKYVLILEGTNDYWTGSSKELTVYMLGAMVGSCRAYGIEPILATLTPDTTRLKGEIKNIPVYNALITIMAEEKDVKLVDMYSPMVDEWETKYGFGDDPWDYGFIDYLHLSREGYHKMAELWYEKLDIPLITDPNPIMTWLYLLL